MAQPSLALDGPEPATKSVKLKTAYGEFVYRRNR